MTKEEQVEEITKILGCRIYGCEECRFSEGKYPECALKQLADEIYTAGYHKVSEEIADWKEIAEGYQKLFEDCYDEKERYKRYYFNHCFDKLRANVEADVKADTVRKMQKLIAEHATNGYPRKVRLDVVDQIAKEMIGGETIE